MKKILRIISLTFPLGFLLCVVGQMMVANQMIVLGNQLGSIDRRINELTQQNDILTRLVTQNSSIQRVAIEAKNEGYVDATSFIAFDDASYPVAIKR